MYKEFNKELRNRNNSYEDLKNVFIKHYSKYPHYTFEFAVLKTIFINKHIDIFEFLFDSGFSYSIEHRIFNSFRKKVKNISIYFIFSSIEFIANHSHNIYFQSIVNKKDIYIPTIDRNCLLNFEKFSLIVQKHILHSIMSRGTFSNDEYSLLFEKILVNKELFSFLKYIVISEYKTYFCSPFYGFLESKSFFDDIPFDMLINKYYLKPFVISQIEKKINNENYLSIIEKSIEYLIRNNYSQITPQLIKIIFSSNNQKFISNLMYCFLLSIKNDIGSFSQELISSFFLYDFPERLIRYNHFFLNKKFPRLYKNITEQIFFDNLDIIKQNHSHKFLNNIDYLDERFKFLFILENF